MLRSRKLLDAAWSDVFVGDAALKVCIREIRRALADDSQNPRYVETAHRRGYRFVASVTIADRPAGTPRHVADVTPSRPRSGPADVPKTHYARSGDVNIAYQVLGEGPIDLVFVMGWVSHLECSWTEPAFARFLRRLSGFSRLMLFDKRGTGLSDRVGALPTLEQRMDDVRAVMTAAGSREAVLLGVSEGGPMCLFATTYPEKTRALIMIGTYAKRLWAHDYPWAPTKEARERFFDEIRANWGGPVGIETRAPSRADDPAFREWWSNYLRLGASPGAALMLTQMNAEIDVRQVLPLVRVPTLVLHRSGDRCLLVDEGRYVAGLIPGAQFVELPGEDHLPFVGDQDAVIDGIEMFLASVGQGEAPDRVLATVLCARIEDRLRDAPEADFDAHARREIARFRGRGVVFTGDRFVAAFDGPARAIACARALVGDCSRFGRTGHFGLHTGECELTPGGHVSGRAYERARAVCERAAAGEVLVSRTVTDLVAGSGVAFLDRGAHPLEPGGEPWKLFAAAGGATQPA